jgi:hypothetical protein
MSTVILQQVRDEMNQVNRVLDEFDSIHGRFRGSRRKRELLERATRASIRGVEALVQEQWTRDPGYLYTVFESGEDEARMREAMRHDAALLDAFVSAECRLLEDLGAQPEAVCRVRRSLAEVAAYSLDPEAIGEPVAEELERLLETLNEDLGALQREEEHEIVKQRLVGSLEVLGGGLVVAADAAVVGGTLPSHGGLAVPAAKISGGAGVGMIRDGVKRALDT